jgi:hypothetical protein
MSWSRIWPALVAFAIAVALAYLAIVLTHDEAQGEMADSVPPLRRSPYDSRLDVLDREAIDEAYKKHVMELFLGWMKDPTKQPERAVVGARRARNAYIDSMTEIDTRK